MKQQVKAECSSCNGTGIYRGFAEPPGVGVVCLNCDGTGCRMVEYTPFTGIKVRKDVQSVRLSKGTLIFAGVGPTGGTISYHEFLNGQRPK